MSVFINSSILCDTMFHMLTATVIIVRLTRVSITYLLVADEYLSDLNGSPIRLITFYKEYGYDLSYQE